MGESSSSFKIITARPIGQIPLRRPGSGWEDNIRMEIERNMWIKMRNWIDLPTNHKKISLVVLNII